MMTKKQLCKSCSGPLNEFPRNQIVKEGFCPYCVDKKGNLKSYGDVLEGMLEYIKGEHKEVAEKEQLATSRKWVREGEVWQQIFKGCIIGESLEDKDLLQLCKIVSTKVETDENPDTNWGETKWTLHQVEVLRADVEELVSKLNESLKLPN